MYLLSRIGYGDYEPIACSENFDTLVERGTLEVKGEVKGQLKIEEDSYGDFCFYDITENENYYSFEGERRCCRFTSKDYLDLAIQKVEVI